MSETNMTDLSSVNQYPESHPLRPFLPESAKLLMCGTFPPQRHRWSMNFYYPNFINDMWRIFGLIYFSDKDYFVNAPEKTFYLQKLKDFLNSKGIALSDTGREVVRKAGNASDKFLDIRKEIDLPAILSEIPDCVAVATTGEKAALVISMMTGTELPKIGEYRECEIIDSLGVVRNIKHWRMPSSSRAYPLPLADKAAYYRKMVNETGIGPD